MKVSSVATSIFAALVILTIAISANRATPTRRHLTKNANSSPSTALPTAIAQNANTAKSKETKLDISQPADALQSFRKLLCSVEDNKTVYFAWEGQVFSHRPGEPDQHLFNVQGMSARACGSLTSETGSPGFRQVSREVMVYLDPETNEILETWTNPWTQATNTVIPVANDPVNTPPMWADTTGKTLQFRTFSDTDTVFLTTTIPLFYPNPLSGEYQSYVGGNYHAMEMFNFSTNRSDLLSNPNQDLEEVALSWSRISPWLPWMEMGDRPGELVFHAASTRLPSWQQLPEPLKSQIATDYALYQNPPALDDDRPNQTTWTNFSEYLEED